MRRARPSGYATFLLLLAGGLLLACLVFVPLWKPLLLALVLAGALGGWQERLTHRMHGRRRLSAALLLVGLVVVVLIPVAAVVTFAIREGIAAVGWVRETLASHGVAGLVDVLPAVVKPYATRWLDHSGVAQDMTSTIPEQGLAALGAVGSALSATGDIAFQTVMMLIALYFLLVDGWRLRSWVSAVSPLGGRATLALLDEIKQTSSSVLVSTAVTAGVQATVAAIGYRIAGVPHVLFFAALTFFAAFIPSVGTSIIGLPLAAYLLLTGHTVGGIFLAAWALLIAGTVDNVLKPVLVRGGAEIHGGLIFFAMIGGIVLFGALGLIVGPASLSLVLALVRLGRREYADRPVNADAETPRLGDTSEPRPPLNA